MFNVKANPREINSMATRQPDSKIGGGGGGNLVVKLFPLRNNHQKNLLHMHSRMLGGGGGGRGRMGRREVISMSMIMSIYIYIY